MSELIRAVRAKADTIHAMVLTRNFQFEGDLHTPKLGKDGRRLSNLLNDPNRKFIVLTNVTIINRADGSKDPKTVPMIQVNLDSVEFIRPYLDEEAMVLESQENDQPKNS